MENHQRCANKIEESRLLLSKVILEESYKAAPGFWEHFGEEGKQKAYKDIGYHLDYLVEALRFDSPELFSAYSNWLAGHFEGLKFPQDKLSQTLTALCHGLDSVLDADLAKRAIAVVKGQSSSTENAGSSFGSTVTLQEEAVQYLDALLKGDRAKASSQIMQLVESGMPIKSIYIDIFQASQLEIGRLWLTGSISVAQEHFCTAATQTIISQLYPIIFSGRRNGKSLVAASVSGELHELGIRMVADFFELEGWASYYLGANVPPRGIVAALQERKASVLCLSTTMVFNLPELDAIIQLVRKTFNKNEVKIIVGGAPFNVSPGLWEKVGADGFAHSAEEAVDEVTALLQ
ncbi:B12-binding domain-containing protein [Treponema sp.]